MIDAANLESSVKDLGWWIDYIKLKALFEKHNLVDIRDYCVHHNSDNQNKFFVFLKHHGFKLVTKSLKIIKRQDVSQGDMRKANFDVEIAVDAIEMANRFDVLVLFSGDSDFNYLIKSLRKKNKKVIVVSTRHHVARELVQSCDKYIDLKDLKNLIERNKKSPSFSTGS